MKKIIGALLLAAFVLTGACATATPDSRDMARHGHSMNKPGQPGSGCDCPPRKQAVGCPSDCPLNKNMKDCAGGCGPVGLGMKSSIAFMEKHRSALEEQKQHIAEKTGAAQMACTEDCGAGKSGDDDPMKKYGLHRTPEASAPGCPGEAAADHMAMMSEMAKKHVEQLMASAAAPRDPHALLPGAAGMKSMHTPVSEPGTHMMGMYRRKNPGMTGMTRVGETMAMIIASAGKIELSDDQSEKVKAVQTDLLKKRIKMNADLRIAELDSMEAIDARKPDMKKAAGSLKKFGTLKAAFDQELLKAFGKIRSILSDEQFEAVRKSVMPPKAGKE